MKKLVILFFMVTVLIFTSIGCRTADPIITQTIVTPDLSVFRTDVYSLFPLIAEPETDADLMYNALIIELSDTLTNQYADMLESYNNTLQDLLHK
jgi:hypothetical protein